MKLVRENINEKFKEKTDPIKDMGIGNDHLLYDINKSDDDTYEFYTQNDKLIELVKMFNRGISENELNRFFAFSMQEIYDEIPVKYFENNDLDKIDKYIKYAIEAKSRGWMGMHSDKAMRSMI